MSCYFVAQIDIHDHHEYERYLDGFDEVFARFNGKVLAVDDQVEVLEGEWLGSRTVMIEFPDCRELERWYRCPEYQSLAGHRRAASTANIVVVRGGD